MKNEELTFLMGMCVGVIVCFLAMLLHGGTVRSNKRVEPKLIITREGVKTDTLFIYKEE